MLEGPVLLHAAAQRIVMRYLVVSGARDVVQVDARLAGASGSVDITCVANGGRTSIKLKADAYFGVDPSKAADRELPFYRGEETAYAFESISHTVTRAQGWMFHSPADYLYYYRLAVPMTEPEIAALVNASDEVFFSELRVERDGLTVLPMQETQSWFEQNFERYTPRPVRVGDHTAWYRLIPAAELRSAIPGIREVGPVFASLAKSA